MIRIRYYFLLRIKMDKNTRVFLYGTTIILCLGALFVAAVIIAAKILPYFLKALEGLG